MATSYCNHQPFGVLRQVTIARQQMQWFADGLREEQAIERIGVERRDVVGTARMGPCDRQRLDARLQKPILKTFDNEVELTRRQLDRYLPDGGGADIDRSGTSDDA